VKYKLNKFNYKRLPELAKTLKQGKVDKIEIELTEKSSDLPYLFELTSFIYQILDYEFYFGIWLINFPYCILNKNCRDHIVPREKYSGGKTEKCKECRYYKTCPGFPPRYFEKYGESEVCAIKDLPVEVMIEVESRCNFSCQFCFNKNSFAEHGRNVKSFSMNYVKKIIDNIVKSGIKVVKFTGGEPMLRKDIFELMKYAKTKKLEVRLNTNCSLINEKNINEFKGIADNILIPIESWDNAREEKITGFKDSLNLKIKAIKLLDKAGIPIIRVGTVANKEIILNFDKMAKLILDLPIDEWEFYRPISSREDKQKLNKQDLEKLVNNIINLRKKTDKYILIANALPFCAISDPNKLNAVSAGALFDDGHNRLVVDPRGFVKPHYFMDKNIGDPLDILKAWNHPFMRKMRNLEFLPKECKKCEFRFKCCGGSRHEAKIFSGSYNGQDPLALADLKDKI